MSKFEIFYYTNRSCNDFCEAMDEPPRFQPGTPYRSDSREQELCCRQCQCCIWPILIPFDLITLPYRGIKHLIKRNKRNKRNNRKTF